jgi:hypothetical protein
MSPALTVIVIIGASVLSSIAGLLWVRRLAPLSFLQTQPVWICGQKRAEIK